MINGFELAGITEANGFAEEVFIKAENHFRENHYVIFHYFSWMKMSTNLDKIFGTK